MKDRTEINALCRVRSLILSIKCTYKKCLISIYQLPVRQVHPASVRRIRFIIRRLGSRTRRQRCFNSQLELRVFAMDGERLFEPISRHRRLLQLATHVPLVRVPSDADGVQSDS